MMRHILEDGLTKNSIFPDPVKKSCGFFDRIFVFRLFVNPHQNITIKYHKIRNFLTKCVKNCFFVNLHDLVCIGERDDKWNFCVRPYPIGSSCFPFIKKQPRQGLLLLAFIQIYLLTFFLYICCTR